MEDSGIIWQL